MTDTEKTHNINPAKRWIIALGIFLIVQLIFIAVDGTSLQPNINDSDKFICQDRKMGFGLEALY